MTITHPYLIEALWDYLTTGSSYLYRLRFGNGSLNAALAVLIATASALAADYTPTATATIESAGDSVLMAWTLEGGWPADMTPYYGAELVLLVDGVEVFAAIPTGWAWTEGDTCYVRRLLSRRVLHGQAVTVVRCESGQAYSEQYPDEWRTWAIAPGMKAMNGSRVYPWSVWHLLGARW